MTIPATEPTPTTPRDAYGDRLEAIGARGPLPIGTANDFRFGLYAVGVSGRPLILQHDGANATLWVPLTDSNKIPDTLAMLDAYAEGDKFVLVRTALTAYRQANMLRQISDLLEEYSRSPMASARFVRQVREIVFGKGAKPGKG